MLGHWLDWRREGKACALLTLVGCDGPAPRPVGSQMAVCEDGRSVGMISGGCIERALVLDAISAMATGANHVERYGSGSRFKDLRLACGSGIDIHFDVTVAGETVEAIAGALDARREAVLSLDLGGRVFERAYRPEVRLMLAGQGPIMACAAALARGLEMGVAAFTPDEDVAAALQAQGFAVSATSRAGGLPLDRYTAVLVLFHDHDLEADVLAKALRSEAFYIGALGSRTAQSARLERLAAMGIVAAGRIHGPVGLDIGAATPPEIALAALAEIVACYRASL